MKPGDMVLLDVGAPVDAFVIDLTRTSVFDRPTALQRVIWALAAAVAIIGPTCAQVSQRTQNFLDCLDWAEPPQ